MGNIIGFLRLMIEIAQDSLYSVRVRTWGMEARKMNRAEIIASTRTGAARVAAKTVGVTPRQKKHMARIAELKRRIDLEKKINEEALTPPVALSA